MEFELLYQPAFAVARVMLEPGESVRAESGAMISMSETVTLESKMPGGIAKAIGRIFGGESIFQSYFTASRGAGEVILAPGSIGDILALHLAGDGYIIWPAMGISLPLARIWPGMQAYSLKPALT